jgi:hypothetical protein
VAKVPGRKNKEFQMTPQLEQFKYEVAQEIGIADKVAKENQKQSGNFEKQRKK